MGTNRNKTLTLILIFCCCVVKLAQSQNVKYIIQSEQVSQIKIYEADNNNRYDLPAFKKTGGGFLLEIANPATSYIITESSEPLKIRLYSVSDSKKTQWFEIGRDELISFQECIIKYEEKEEWSISSMTERITNFFNLGRNGLVLEGENAVMHGSSKWISFSVAGLPEFISPNSMFFKWENTVSIAELKVIDVKSNKTILINQNPTYQVFTNDKPQKIGKFKKGRFYKFIFTPSDNDQDFGPKSIVAYFYSKKEIKQINSFIKN